MAKAKKEKAVQAFSTLTFSDCFNGLVTIESEDGKLFTVTQHRKGNLVTAETIEEAQAEAAKYVNDTQF